MVPFDDLQLSTSPRRTPWKGNRAAPLRSLGTLASSPTQYEDWGPGGGGTTSMHIPIHQIATHEKPTEVPEASRMARRSNHREYPHQSVGDRRASQSPELVYATASL